MRILNITVHKEGFFITNPQVFIHLEPKIEGNPEQILKVKNIATVHCIDEDLKNDILELEIHRISINKKNDVISILDVIKEIQTLDKNAILSIFGHPEILVNIKEDKDSNSMLQYIKITLVSVVLFLGAALAIINFHEDVNMKGSLQSFHEIITGEKSENPMLLQISYSLGIGIGMITFFNHVLKKKWKKEPSPLDVEMHLFEKNIDEYILDTTKQINKDKS